MANTPRKKKPAPRKKPVAKAVEEAVKEDAQEAPEPETIAPMHPDAFRLAMTIVNNADIKGGDAETIILLKRELARVSGQVPGAPRS